MWIRAALNFCETVFTYAFALLFLQEDAQYPFACSYHYKFMIIFLREACVEYPGLFKFMWAYTCRSDLIFLHHYAEVFCIQKVFSTDKVVHI